MKNKAAYQRYVQASMEMVSGRFLSRDGGSAKPPPSLFAPVPIVYDRYILFKLASWHL